MDRRTYLALVTTALAGCASSEETSTDSPTGTATPTESASPTATDAPTPTETETSTATPSDESIAADHLDTARGRLRDAVGSFTAPADGDTILAVDGSVDPDVDAVTAELEEMTAELDAAAEHATDDQAATVADLRHLRWYLGRVVAVQADAHGLWTAAGAGIGAAVSESFADLDERRNQLKKRGNAVSEGVDALAADADPGATAATDLLDESEYTGKREQFGAEHGTAGAIRSVLDPTRSGMSDFGGGVDDYTSGKYSNADVKLWAAKGSFEDAIADLPSEPAAAYQSHVGDLRSFLETILTVTEKLQRSAELGRELVTEDEVMEILESWEYTGDSPSASQLLEWLQNR